ncbi:hypothetical protein GUITHDRAFT_116356 [Guillardia theta CCMP2712]|uniref:Uncharacterized protein n=1 Tax=Guillardia theta (strain CCMP2712) TaxID=905079 RepID=L1IMR5_GUITC|nr:hypothetical protein GUITHDRAFT_116356 [Guillardia theta CCMP2712]EKX37548.1 hypothetical protein GUITHDRAFT_116356 [Guillardia theta CCMP2712]|eukprot:XP_005824528.1 hypothetical protein GUITHDRAFT_116356 [Guillardia theta CCMP2712]
MLAFRPSPLLLKLLSEHARKAIKYVRHKLEDTLNDYDQLRKSYEDAMFKISELESDRVALLEALRADGNYKLLTYASELELKIKNLEQELDSTRMILEESERNRTSLLQVSNELHHQKVLNSTLTQQLNVQAKDFQIEKNDMLQEVGN